MCDDANSAVGPLDASGKLAYVRVATFNKQTTESAKAALRQLKADGATRQSSLSPFFAFALPFFFWAIVLHVLHALVYITAGALKPHCIDTCVQYT